MKDNHHERIKDIARELFFKYGPKRVSMDDIAEGTGISKKTLYQNFHSKNDLVHEVVAGLIQSHIQHSQTIQLSASDAIEEVLTQDGGLSLMCNSIRPRFFYELEVYFPDIWNDLEKYKLRIQDHIQKNLLRGKEEGLYRDDLNIPLVSYLRMQLLANALRPELTHENTVLYLRSITSEKGKKLLDKYLKTKL
jgi:AcrR family transcriptional regulator